MEAKLNGKTVKLSRPVKGGDRLELSWLAQVPEYLHPENIPLDILYEDNRIVVVNKTQGMVVHPGAGNPSGTLANALLYRRLARQGAFPRETSAPETEIPGGTPLTGGASPSGGDGNGVGLRTGIVHRLDKDTSGVILAAYDDEALAFLADQFKTRRVDKRYAALVTGTPREGEGRIETTLVRDPLDRKRFTVSSGRGKQALTLYRVIRSWGAYSLLLLKPKTGRTHQLRVHLRSLGHPILGDPLYGFRDKLFPEAALMLHALSLSIVLPGNSGETFPNNREPSLFKAPLPDRFRELVHTLNRMADS
jgi:23S rRNA pseudouridine1911/1915/1917 synthase